MCKPGYLAALLALFILLGGCGSSGSDSDDDMETEAETAVNCVLGTSTIGSCQI